MKHFVAAIIMVVSSSAYSAQQIDADVNAVGVRWEKGCATLSSGHTLHLDLETEAGKAEYSTILAAYSMNKKVTVYIKDTKTPNICNVHNVADHGMIYLKK